MDDARFRQLNELKVGIETSDILVEVDWFHVIRSNDFCNLKWHMHPSVEMHCVLEGEDDFCLPDETVAVNAGQCLMIPPKMPHKRLPQNQRKDLLKFSINFTVTAKTDQEEAEFLQDAFRPDRFRLLCFPQRARELMTCCLHEANERQYGFLTNISSYLLSALVILARELTEYPVANYPVSVHKGINDERYQIIEKYIATHLCDDLTVQSLAQYMNLSTKQLGRIVTSCSDYRSVSDMILSARLELAKRLLRQPELNNAAIAKQAGFSSEYYFNHVFKQKVGLPPGRYRKSLRAV